MKLAGFERRWAATIARALVPADALDGTLADIDLGARYAHECAISPWYAALLFRACLWMVWLSPLARLRTFGGLDEAGRVEMLERLLKHPIYQVRMSTMMLKLAICSMLLGDEPTLRRIGAYKLDTVDARNLARARDAS